MLRKNDEIQLRIEGIGSNMEGVARHEGLVCFVPFALLGEEVRVKIVQVKKDYCHAKLLEVINPSLDRAEPFCPHYKKCGGCSLQHANYNTGLLYKKSDVQNCFSKIANTNLKDFEIQGLDVPLNYRNKAIFPLVNIDGKIAFGYYQKRSHRLIEISECNIVNRDLFLLAKSFVDFANEKQLSAYNETTRQGVLRHIQLRINSHNEIALHIIINEDSLKFSDEIVRHLTNVFPKLVSISYSVNKESTNSVLGSKTRVIFGKEQLNMQLSGLNFLVSPQAFFQVNVRQFENIISYAKASNMLSKEDTLFDIYCGAGSIGLCLKDMVKEIIGVEIVREAVDNAKENAKINKLASSATYHLGQAEDILPTLAKNTSSKSVAILDPPRKGCDEKLLNALSKSNIDRLIYISCHPASQARDIAILKQLGYNLVSARAFDMFCYTAELENVCLLCRDSWN